MSRILGQLPHTLPEKDASQSYAICTVDDREALPDERQSNVNQRYQQKQQIESILFLWIALPCPEGWDGEHPY